jgi:hypothetical protein
LGLGLGKGWVGGPFLLEVENLRVRVRVRVIQVEAKSMRAAPQPAPIGRDTFKSKPRACARRHNLLQLGGILSSRSQGHARGATHLLQIEVDFPTFAVLLRTILISHLEAMGTLIIAYAVLPRLSLI